MLLGRCGNEEDTNCALWSAMAPHLIPFIALLVAKKAVGYGLYVGLQRYGVARAYRRLAEIAEIARRVLPAERQKEARKALRTAFRFPEATMDAIQKTDVRESVWAAFSLSITTLPSLRACRCIRSSSCLCERWQLGRCTSRRP